MKGGDRYVAKKQVNSIDEIRSATKMAIGYGVRRAAIVLGNEISDAYDTVIKRFYDHLDPKNYKRTESLYKAAVGVGEKKSNGKNRLPYKRLGDHKWQCGINVDHNNIPPNTYDKNPMHGREMDTKYVFWLAYDRGIHGFNQTMYENIQEHYDAIGHVRWYVPRDSIPDTLNNPRPSKHMSLLFRQINNRSHVGEVLFRCIDEFEGRA